MQCVHNLNNGDLSSSVGMSDMRDAHGRWQERELRPRLKEAKDVPEDLEIEFN